MLLTRGQIPEDPNYTPSSRVHYGITQLTLKYSSYNNSFQGSHCSEIGELVQSAPHVFTNG